MRLSIYTRLDPSYALCRDIRTKVFVEEYNVPVSQERDSADYGAIHYLIRHNDNTPIGVARSNIEGDYCMIRRFALLPQYRNDTALQSAFALVLQDCKKRYPFMPMQVYAQSHQEEFYASFGFVIQGDSFVDAGFALHTMILTPQAEKTSLTNAVHTAITEAAQPV